MKITINNVATGKTEDRDMTAEEEKDFNDMSTVGATQAKEIEDGIAKKATDQAAATAKLKALGLTDDEIVALIN
tara:strand:+ start:1295 stop:1516 length:222 start_codon:yes stop_codon:yes gene_type:complete